MSNAPSSSFVGTTDVLTAAYIVPMVTHGGSYVKPLRRVLSLPRRCEARALVCAASVAGQHAPVLVHGAAVPEPDAIDGDR
jgi:hypothetical protein